MRTTIFLLFFFLPTLPFPVFAGETPGKLWAGEETVLTATLLVGAGGLFLVDEDIRRGVQKNRGPGPDALADSLNALGHPVTGLGIAASLWGAGEWREDTHLAETGKLSLQAVLIADLTTFILKAGAGRERPGKKDDAASFRPFTFENDRDSLPSGHAASAFALASVLSQRSVSRSAPYLYYGLAGLVGLARVYDDKHWASDVVVGALVGELAGRMVVRLQERKAVPLQLTPLVGGAMVSLALAW